mmetsp:Transcript_351/g.604  ORF Transcript_351/g.604 Transcript_351/m.604 type:complete len:193 (-) Transcript_351:251-829(-)
MDVLSGSYSDNTVAWYKNDGNEVFTKHVIANDAAGTWDVFAIDMDGDGDIDVLSASELDDTVAWYENDGSEAFTKHVITNAADGAYAVFAIDLDQDGNMDALSASRGDGTVAWYEHYTPPAPTSQPSTQPSSRPTSQPSPAPKKCGKSRNIIQDLCAGYGSENITANIDGTNCFVKVNEVETCINWPPPSCN